MANVGSDERVSSATGSTCQFAGQLADQGQQESGGPREWRSTGGAGGAGSPHNRGTGLSADNAFQCVDQDARHDDGVHES